MLAGLNLTPAKKAHADEIPGKVTVIDFSDESAATDWNSLAEIKTATGSAITVGGKTQWNHGVIIIEPQNGWGYSDIWSDRGESLTVQKLSAVISTVTANSGGKIPDAVKNLFDSYSDEQKNTLEAVYINRALYNKIYYGSVTVEFEKNGAYSETEFNILTDQLQFSGSEGENAGITVNIGDEFNIFDIERVKTRIFDGGYTKADYSIAEYGIDSTPPNALKRLYESEQDADYGKYRADISGINALKLTNTRTGVSYEYQVKMIDENMPLKKADFKISDDVKVISDTEPDDSGKYSLYSKDSAFIKELSIAFTLPNDCEIEEVTFAGEDLEESVPRVVDINEEGYECPARAEYKKTGSDITILLSSTQDNIALRSFLRIIIKKGISDYVYNFSIDTERWMGGQGQQLIPAAVGSTLRLMEFIHLNDPNDEQKLYDGITDGTYIVNMQGVKPAFENGVFKGKLIVYYPCERMNLWDTTSSTVLYSGSADIRVKASTLIEAGTSVDLAELINGYWAD